jgi:hypothetical protein
MTTNQSSRTTLIPSGGDAPSDLVLGSTSQGCPPPPNTATLEDQAPNTQILGDTLKPHPNDSIRSSLHYFPRRKKRPLKKVKYSTVSIVFV